MTTDDNPQGNMRPPKGKYRPLYNHLKNLGDVSEWTTSFGEIERILGDDLPNSARRRVEWWGNESGDTRHVQARAWMSAGWEVSAKDLKSETVTFVRRRITQAKSDA